MFSKLKRKDKNELRRVHSNDSAKSSKSVKSGLRSLLTTFRTDSRTDDDEPAFDYVAHFLRSNGLPQPKTLLNEEIKLSIADHEVFLPTLTRDDDDELRNDDVGGGDDVVTYTFVVVLGVPKPTKLSLEMNLKCLCKNYWPNLIPDSNKIRNEVFELGNLKFDLSLQNYNMFVPWSGEMGSRCSYNSNVIPATKYTPFIVDDVIEGDYYIDDPSKADKKNQVIFPPGEYVYLVPISFPLSIPESVITEFASINYSFDFNVHVDENKDHYVEHFVNLIRSPPNLELSTYNKPIYINKVWSDALNYEISFPQKFVTINDQEIQIKLNFIPLVKNLNVSKIKVNILQKISYLNKELNHERYELDEVKYKNGHSVNLLEIRPTDSKFSSFAAREETISSNLIKNRNLLTCSYVNETTNSEHNQEIIGPLSIKAYMHFVKPSRPLKYYKDNQFFNENTSLSDMLVHKNRAQMQRKPNHRTVLNQVPLTARLNTQFIDGLLPSASTFYIHVQHKLQVSLIIARKTDKVHNYEVLIDTPIVLLNSACKTENLELPAYEDTLPTFEEATSASNSPPTSAFSSPLNSPIISPYEETYLSRVPTIGTGSILGSPTPFYHDEDGDADLVDQIDDLLLSRNHNNSMEMRRGSTGATIVNTLKRTMSRDPPNYNEALEGDINESTDLTEQYHRL